MTVTCTDSNHGTSNADVTVAAAAGTLENIKLLLVIIIMMIVLLVLMMMMMQRVIIMTSRNNAD